MKAFSQRNAARAHQAKKHFIEEYTEKLQADTLGAMRQAPSPDDLWHDVTLHVGRGGPLRRVYTQAVHSSHAYTAASIEAAEAASIKMHK